MGNILDGIFPALTQSLLNPSFMGTTCTMKIKEGTYDHLTAVETSTGATGTINCSARLEYKKKDIDGTRIKFGDSYIYVGNLDWEKLAAVESDFGTEPTLKMAVQFKSKDYAIIEIGPLESGAEIPAWKLQLRG